MATLAVDPQRTNDVNYRYQMDPVTTKVEGSGNGIKTVIVNASKIADTLVRKVDHLMKFLAMELAATDKLMHDKYILTGKHERQDVQDKIYAFITRFCLCKKCRNPETELYVDEKSTVNMRCVACGVINSIDPGEKLIKVILKTEVPKQMLSRKEQKAKKTTADQEAKQWREALGDTALGAGELKELENPVTRMRRELAEIQDANGGERLSDRDIYSLAVNIRTEYSLSDIHLVQLIFESVFTEDMIANPADSEPERYKGLISRVVRDDAQRRVLIEELIAFCWQAQDSDNENGKALVAKFAVVLMAFMKANLLPQEFLCDWYRQPPRVSLSIKDQLEARARAKPLIDFLEQDSDEDEEDADEDGDSAEDSDDDSGDESN